MNLTEKPTQSPTFTKQTHETLATKGIRILHATPIPASTESSVSKGWAVIDNGVYRIWTYSQVMAVLVN